jgi:hypothetical protein
VRRGETAHSPLAPETVLFSYMTVLGGPLPPWNGSGAGGDQGVAAVAGEGARGRRERVEGGYRRRGGQRDCGGRGLRERKGIIFNSNLRKIKTLQKKHRLKTLRILRTVYNTNSPGTTTFGKLLSSTR